MSKWTCSAARDLPLDETSSWDGSAASGRLLDAAGIGTDNAKPEQAARGFLIYDAAQPALRGSYHLPFCDLKDGKLTVLASGIRAAASRLLQMEGASDAVKSEAGAVIDAYEQKLSTEKSAPAAAMAFPVLTRAALTTDGMLAKASASAPDPSIFEDTPPFFWSSEASSSYLDSYFTHMLPSSLRNFAGDMQQGVSFQNSHNTMELGFGRSIDGRYIGAGGNGVSRAEGDFYTLPGLNLNGVSTDDLIRGIRSGLVAHNSVGFSLGQDGRYMCDLCNRDLMDCNHYPGVRYAVEGRKDPALCTAGIDNAHMAELSAVYAGATPGAGVLKAQRASEAGLLDPKTARLLETCYRIALPAAHHRWPGADLKEKPMPDEPILTPPPPPEPVPAFGSPQIRALMEAAGLKPGESDEVNFRSLSEVVRKLPAIEAERERLAALADDGKQYRAHLIDSALKEGVRAYGAEKFPGEQYRAQFENAPLEFVRTNLNLWTAMGDDALKGGRQTVDVGEPEPNGAALPRPFTHPGAYAG